MRKLLILGAWLLMAARPVTVKDNTARALTNGQRTTLQNVLDTTHCDPIDTREGDNAACESDENIPVAELLFEDATTWYMSAAPVIGKRVTVPGGTYDELQAETEPTTRVLLSTAQRAQLSVVINNATCNIITGRFGAGSCDPGTTIKVAVFTWQDTNGDNSYDQVVVTVPAEAAGSASYDAGVVIPKSRTVRRSPPRNVPTVPGNPGRR